jgi:hypothetical protein
VLSLLSGLFDFIKCLVLYAVGALLAGLEVVLNLLIAGVMALLGPILAALAAISPSLGSVSLPSFIAQLNWFLPIGFFVALTLAMFAFEALWPLFRLVLNWLKGL